MNKLHINDPYQKNNINYSASYPPGFNTCCSKVAKVAWLIFSIIIFPIALFRLGTMIAFNKFQSKVADRAQYTEGKVLRVAAGVQSLRFSSPDGTKLDAGYFKGTKNADKAIIYVPGLGARWQDCPAVNNLTSLGAHLVTVNRRGAGFSERGDLSNEGSILDVWAAYEFLTKEKGLAPENVLFMGHSWGGALATKAAAIVQRMHPEKEIKVINWSSFSNFASAARAIIKNQDTCCLLPILASTCLRFSSYNMDVASDLKIIKQKAVLWHKEDKSVPHSSQVVSHLEKKGGFYSFALEKGDHGTDFTPNEWQAFKGLAQRMLHISVEADQGLYNKLVTKVKAR